MQNEGFFFLLQAIDLDSGDNAAVSYYQVGKMHMTLTEGLDDIEIQPFLVNKLTGVVSLNFDPQRGMKGYFDFMVSLIFKRIVFYDFSVSIEYICI